MPEISTTVSSGVYYRKTGSGPAIFLLHGFPASGTLWHNIWGILSESCTVITPDFPGSGNSSLNSETCISDMAEVVKAIMDHERLDKAVMAGHSMGGYVAFEFARLYPQKVAGLSLVHSSPFADDEEKKNTRRKSIRLIQNGGKDVFISQMIPNLFSPSNVQSHPEMVAAQVEDSLKMDGNGMINFYNAMISRHDNSKVLISAAFPVQWIFGIDDNIIPYKKILRESRISDVNFVSLYNSCGHMSMLEAPANLAADLHEFSSYSFRRLL